MENNKLNIKFYNHCHYKGDAKTTWQDVDSSLRVNHTYNFIEFGDDNLYPQKLLYLYENAPTHAAILKKKTSYLAAPLVNLGNDKLKYVINNHRGLQDLLTAAAMDYSIHNAFCLQIVFYKGRREIADIIYQDVSEVRRGTRPLKDGTNMQEQGVYLSMNWRYYAGEAKYNPKFYKLFDWKMLTGEDGVEVPDEPVFLYVYKPSPGRDWYPLASYQAGIKSIITEIEAVNFSQKSYENGFNPSGILQIPSELDQLGQAELERKIEDELTGTDNANRVMVVQGTGEDVVTWTPFNESPDYSGFLDMKKENQDLIVTAHELPSGELIGNSIGTASLGGDANKLAVAAKEYYNRTIKPQRTFIYDTFDKLINKGMNIDYTIETEENLNYETNTEEK